MSIRIDVIPLEQLVSTMQQPSWASGPLYFVGDIGGTNARLGFGHKASGSDATQAAVHIVYVHFGMSKKHVGQLAEFFEVILKEIRQKGAAGGEAILKRVASGAISVPGPVSESGTVAGPFNNLRGVTNLLHYPTELFPPGHSSLLNDLQAGGYGVLAISDAGVFDEYFAELWEGSMHRAARAGHDAKRKSGHKGFHEASGVGSGPCLIVAPGTGLGTSLIYPAEGPTAAGGSLRFSVLPLEFGSITLPYRLESNDYALALAEFLHGQKAKTGVVRLPIAEDSSCGGGIVFHYYHLLSRSGSGSHPMPKSLKDAPLTAGMIAKLAKEQHDPVAVGALAMAYESLMHTSSEAVMTFLPHNVVVIGDNIVRNSFFFEDKDHVAKLQKALYRHPMQTMGFLGRPSFLRQTKSINLNLLGGYGYGTRTTAEAQSQPSKL